MGDIYVSDLLYDNGYSAQTYQGIENTCKLVLDIPSQQKTVNISQNGSKTITGDYGRYLSSVTINTHVPSEVNNQVIQTITSDNQTVELQEGYTGFIGTEQNNKSIKVNIPKTVLNRISFYDSSTESGYSQMEIHNSGSINMGSTLTITNNSDQTMYPMTYKDAYILSYVDWHPYTPGKLYIGILKTECPPGETRKYVNNTGISLNIVRIYNWGYKSIRGWTNNISNEILLGNIPGEISLSTDLSQEGHANWGTFINTDRYTVQSGSLNPN